MGEVTGRAKMVLRLLRRRFGELPPELPERLRHLTAEQLDDLAEALLDFSSLTDVTDWLARAS